MKRKLITSALPYINGVKHLGNLVGSMLPADFCARFFRQQGYEVLYICGTDEHGAPAELGALKHKITIEEYCRQNYQLQKEIYKKFNISFDYFGRTSSSVNKNMTQEVFLDIDNNGFITEGKIKQYYCADDHRFLPDRYIEGECPKCGFKDARGDQCDGCGALLNPSDLVNPRSALSGSKNLQLIETNHLFLSLDKLESKVANWLNNQSHWPATVSGIAQKWLKEGLKPRCITRDLSWGVQVPKKGYENKVFYVWFDAPIGYLSMTKEWAIAEGRPNEWLKWWKDPENVDLIQFMAKDNVPFHTFFWPAMMIGTCQPWTFASYIKGLNWLTYEGNKFSTSRQKGVFTDKALTLFPADYWRYTLFAMMPENSDSDFTFSAMAQIINKDLADNLGNFNNRIIKIIEKNYESCLPEGFVLDAELQTEVSILINDFESHMSSLHFRKACISLRKMWALGNEFIHKNEPWKKIKTDKLEASNILKNGLYLLNIYSCSLAPITPDLSCKIRKELRLEHEKIPPAKLAQNIDWLRAEIKIDPVTGPLIEKIIPDVVENLTVNFSGKIN